MLNLWISTALALLFALGIFSFSMYMNKISELRKEEDIDNNLDDQNKIEEQQKPIKMNDMALIDSNKLLGYLLTGLLVLITIISILFFLFQLHKLNENTPKLAVSINEMYGVTVEQSISDEITCYQGVLHYPQQGRQGLLPFQPAVKCTNKELIRLKAKYSINNSRAIMNWSSLIFLLSLFLLAVKWINWRIRIIKTL